jgi:hypothetical protein
MKQEISGRRRLFMVLSSRSMPYARLALESLYQKCVDLFSLSLITDTNEDAFRLEIETKGLTNDQAGRQQAPLVYGDEQLTELAQERFRGYEHIREFRKGHPCWRKITDPVLLSHGNDEMVILDPDLYFPNRFRFESTLASGVLLMWQRPSCLLPAETVEAAIAAKIPLAHHTDIGVAQWRMPVDLEWLNWLIGKLGSSELPRSMHVESIVWAALAMRIGGGHLDPNVWLCWHRTQLNRLLLKLGASGPSVLKRESLRSVKCFHAGGEAKWWLSQAHQLGILDHGQDLTQHTKVKPYQELLPSDYQALQRNRRFLQALGYYSVFGGR